MENRGALDRAVQRVPLFAGLPSAVLVVAAIAFCVALGFGIAAPALPLYARSFGVSAFLASAVISVFALMRFVTSPAAGSAIGRFGERRILTSGLLIVAASSLLAGLSGTYPQLLIMRGLGGIGSAMFTVSAMSLLLRMVAPGQRGRASGSFQAGFLLGGVLGPAVGGAVIGLSVRAPFFVYAGTLAVAAYVAWRYLPAHVGVAGERADLRAPGAGTPLEPAPTFASALRLSAYRASLAANLTNGFVTFGLRMSLVPLFVVEGLRQSEQWAGIAFLVAAVANVAVLTAASRMSDRTGRRPAMIIGTAATAAGMVALAVAGAPVIVLGAMAVLGVASAFMGSAPAATAGDIAGSHGKGSLIAGFQMTADFGAIVGPLAAGLLLDAFGFTAAFLVGAAVAAVAALMARAMHETLHTARA